MSYRRTHKAEKRIDDPHEIMKIEQKRKKYNIIGTAIFIFIILALLYFR